MATSSNPYEHYNEPEIEDDLIDPDDADLNDLDDPLHPTTTTSSRAPLRGNITPQTRPLNQTYLTSAISGEDRRAPQNTIDESVWATLSRDLLAIWSKMREVLYPRYILGGSMMTPADITSSLRGTYENIRGQGFGGVRAEASRLAGRVIDADRLLNGASGPADNGEGGGVGASGMSVGLRDWDLWGPLVFCLALSLLLSFNARADQKSVVFSGVFAMVWIGEAVVTVQIKLLGGNVSFAQSVCIIGYTLFPLVLAALMSALHLPMLARIPTYLILIFWSVAAGVSILSGSGVIKNRVGIAVYPLLVFYLGLGCLCFIS